jgi:hypothetical protein
LEKAIEVVSFSFDDRYWELPSRKRARAGAGFLIKNPADIATSTLRLIPHNGTRFGYGFGEIALPD